MFIDSHNELIWGFRLAPVLVLPPFGNEPSGKVAVLAGFCVDDTKGVVASDEQRKVQLPYVRHMVNRIL